MIIRRAENKDAEAFWQMQYELDQETKYMMYEPNERKKDIKRIKDIISNAVSGENLLLMAENDNKIVGYLAAQRGEFNRIRHNAYIVIGIRKDYQHMGIGTKLFLELDQWAKDNNLKRLELTVMCPNEPARHLYEKCGFVIEGIKKHSMLVDGEYIDEYYMSKIL